MVLRFMQPCNHALRAEKGFTAKETWTLFVLLLQRGNTHLENDCVPWYHAASPITPCLSPFSLLRLTSAQLLLLLQQKELILQHKTLLAPDLALAFVCFQPPSKDRREKKGGKGDKRAQIKGRDPRLMHRVHLRVETGRSAGVRLAGSPPSQQNATQRSPTLTKLLPKPNAVNMAPAPASQSQRERV